MKITIIGSEGTFGSFLWHELGKIEGVEFPFDPTDADFVIMAVPISAYDDVARTYAGQHLVNVCSVQRKTNEVCLRHSDNVTGIHPMFGPNSPMDGRTCIVTHVSQGSDQIVEIFKQICSKIVTHANDHKIDGRLHDEMMRKTHLPVLMFGELASLIVEQASDVPDDCLPTSFKRLKALADQMKDMSPGTVESIRSNK